MNVESNFDFLTIDLDTAELFTTANMAEKSYTQEDYETTLFKVRKIAENTAWLIADREYMDIPERTNFNGVLRLIKDRIDDTNVVDYFYKIKQLGNDSAHNIKSKDATKENALDALQDIFYILVWFVIKYVNPDVSQEWYHQFLEPQAQELYSTATRKFIYIQTVKNENGLFNAYDGSHKIGEGSISEDDLEADWSPNSDFLREVAPKRIKQYMTTSGLPYILGWVELAYKKSTKTWFHDKDVHKVLTRSGISHSKYLEGNEWFETDLETAKQAIKAVKEGREYLQNIIEETPQAETRIELRPEQKEAVAKTQKVFKKKDKMLWNAKMRFGKTMTSLQLIKEEQFQKVLIMTHRPVVSDSWFEDYRKLKMDEAGYEYGSVNKGAHITSLKKGDKPFIYFASIQLLRYNNGETNLKDFSDVDWDLIIIDEAHEGTQTELSDIVLKQLIKENTKVLELSGTPFNLLDQFDEDQVYTWDYTMEQQAKTKWKYEHPDEPNPYDSLPKVLMYIFEMKNKAKFMDESKSFNFREFFRTDENEQLVYKKEVNAFLDNITNKDSKTNYPFSTPEYRNELRHTLWIMPGIKEANAFEDLLNEHPIFGKEYKIVNVVRGSYTDNGVTNEADIEKVRNAITDDPTATKTITLTVRKLTTGVNVPQWTAVMFLSNTNSAMNYLQAAFRAQTPYSHEKLGKKERCYIFDFAPDRALTVMAESAQINTGVGKKNTEGQKQAMTNLLNFLPILGSSETGMKDYNVDSMLTQLKKVYAEKAVRSGFEDDSLYNDNLLTLTAEDASMFNKLNAIVGKTQKTKASNKVTVNENGLTDEEYKTGEQGQKKPARKRTEEEKAAIEKIKEAKKDRKKLISILRGVSIRIPMMIYGMKVDFDKDITIKDFINKVDDESWKEFMPKGFTKGMFSEITKYYDAEVFIEAGRIIRQRAKSFDSLDFIERAERVAELFGSFKNPDKETVLTPWRVVNMQTAKSVGGLNFYDDDFTSTTNGATSNLHWVEKDITSEIYHPDTKILDINSKTGLYPLHAAISLYYQKVVANDDNHFEADKVYQDILANNVYAVAKTPMAKTITERTLTGYHDYKTNVKYIEDLTDILKNDIEEGKQKVEEAFNQVKFDVVIGNPPYQESATDKVMRAGHQQRVNNVFHLFQQLSDELKPNHSVLIYPGGRWMQQSGRGMQEFGTKLINSPQLSHLIYYPNANDVFGDVSISDGISVVHKDYSKEANEFNYVLAENGSFIETKRKNPGEQTFIIYPIDESIVNKINKFVIDNNLDYLSSSSIINQKLFQIESNFVEMNPDKVELYTGQKIDKSTQIKLLANDKAGKAGRATWFVANRDVIKVHRELIDKYKVVVSSANAGGQKRDNQLTILEPYTAFGRSRLALKAFDTEVEAQNFYEYVNSYFIRFAFLLTDENLSSLAKLVPDLLDYSNSQKLIDFSNDIDKQLFDILDLTSEEIQRIKQRVESIRS
ncbi:Type II restriction endonuclease [Streptococcus infantarius subsp. infantarius]|nr:Type II restriction endonuclease [Streptococcus infantarius subsp. infantarius]MCO4671780.1 Type II restriction endonuclease [Streptococcus infantarius subsp. infantarius]MCO4673243.1 Type II restriction endonuclease [Streptococcus infantarius subsp. infantarius]MCO4674671.1 Type II restriction endonuclease [Streptococcus infantarius subsp. infantarius]MCO4676407.1 Type II restriction endonuclease [Streptococcus infantarius subsp. infantarius]